MQRMVLCATSRKRRPLADYFRKQEVLNTGICAQNRTDIFLIYLSVTYFQFQFPLFVSFYSTSTEVTADASPRNLCQR